MTTDTVETTAPAETEIDMSLYVLKADVRATARALTAEHGWCGVAFDALSEMGITRAVLPKLSTLPVGTVLGRNQYAYAVFVKMGENEWLITSMRAFDASGEIVNADSVRETVADEDVLAATYFVIYRPDGNYASEEPTEGTVNMEDYILKSTVLRISQAFARPYDKHQKDIVNQALRDLGIDVPKPPSAADLPVNTSVGMRTGSYDGYFATKTAPDKWELTSIAAFNARGEATGSGTLRRVYSDAQMDDMNFFVIYNPTGTYVE